MDATIHRRKLYRISLFKKKQLCATKKSRKLLPPMDWKTWICFFGGLDKNKHIYSLNMVIFHRDLHPMVERIRSQGGHRTCEDGSKDKIWDSMIRAWPLFWKAVKAFHSNRRFDPNKHPKKKNEKKRPHKKMPIDFLKFENHEIV